MRGTDNQKGGSFRDPGKARIKAIGGEANGKKEKKIEKAKRQPGWPGIANGIKQGIKKKSGQRNIKGARVKEKNILSKVPNRYKIMWGMGRPLVGKKKERDPTDVNDR